LPGITHQQQVNYRWGGLIRGLLILGAWAGSVAGGLFLVPVTINTIPGIVPLIVWIAFLYTGMFITAHDAMHRTLLPRDPWWNDFVGQTCVRLFALFSYAKLRDKHAEHHRDPGTQADPDYHDGRHRGLLAWYFHFMWEYVTARQITGMGIVFITLWLVLGAPVANVILFWALPAILSTWQLFYFGTYLPHREPIHGYTNPHHARSNAYPRWLSFLTCYHFGYHLEHHEYPFVPWWKLGRVRDQLVRSASPEHGSMIPEK
jgi:beta-carotene ketolase (CrtW type)